MSFTKFLRTPKGDSKISVPSRSVSRCFKHDALEQTTQKKCAVNFVVIKVAGFYENLKFPEQIFGNMPRNNSSRLLL